MTLDEMVAAWQRGLAEMVLEHQRTVDELVEFDEFHRNKIATLEREVEQWRKAAHLGGVFPKEAEW